MDAAKEKSQERKDIEKFWRYVMEFMLDTETYMARWLLQRGVVDAEAKRMVNYLISRVADTMDFSDDSAPVVTKLLDDADRLDGLRIANGLE